MLGLADKDRRTAIIIVFHMFKELEERMHTLSRDAEDNKKDLSQWSHKMVFREGQ